jgi:ubiquinone biosynthesis protein COQ9
MTPKQQKTFDSILRLVPAQGWTPTAFAQGVKQSGATPAEATKLFPHGIDDVVNSFHAMINDAMHARIKAKRNFTAMRVRDKITFAVRARLESAAPHREAMRRLLLRSLLPRHIRHSTRQLWHSSDAIWKAAGDASTDYNHYTKRILLIAVMKSTLSFWLSDNSAGYTDTWSFLDRRIADVMSLGKTISVAKTVRIPDIVSFLRTRFAA